MSAQSSGATGPQVAHDKIDRYRALGAFGKPVHQSHVQLRAMLLAKCGKRAANYFARPTYDPELGELRWTAEVSGQMRAWQDMTAQEQADRALDLEVIHSQLKSYAQDLRRQSGGAPGGAASFASLLEQSLSVPQSGSHLFVVGDQPVIAFWGFEDQNGASIEPGARAPRREAAPVAQTMSAAEPVIPDPAEPLKPPVRKRSWWRWFRWLLFALLLLALLLLLPRACTFDGGFGFKPDLSGFKLPEAKLPALPDVKLGSEGRPLPAAPDLKVSPPAGNAALGLQVPDGRYSAESTVPSADLARPEEGQRPVASDVPEPLRPSGQPPESGTVPGMDPALPPGNESDQSRPAGPPQEMQLPDDQRSAQKMSFLEGNWKAGDGLLDKETKQPLDMSFRFGKEGQGEVTLRRPDGTVCSGPVNGRMDGGKLYILGQQQIPCNSGGGYGAPRIECEKDGSGQTQCFGVNPDGSRYSMSIERR